jgi:hypothetical protein
VSEPAYRLFAVPDILDPDGMVRRGWLPEVIHLGHLRLRRQATWASARELIEVHSKDRPFTRPEQDRWDLLMTELNKLDEMIIRAMERLRLQYDVSARPRLGSGSVTSVQVRE